MNTKTEDRNIVANEKNNFFQINKITTFNEKFNTNYSNINDIFKEKDFVEKFNLDINSFSYNMDFMTLMISKIFPINDYSTENYIDLEYPLLKHNFDKIFFDPNLIHISDNILFTPLLIKISNQIKDIDKKSKYINYHFEKILNTENFIDYFYLNMFSSFKDSWDILNKDNKDNLINIINENCSDKMFYNNNLFISFFLKVEQEYKIKILNSLSEHELYFFKTNDQYKDDPLFQSNIEKLQLISSLPTPNNNKEKVIYKI